MPRVFKNYKINNAINMLRSEQWTYSAALISIIILLILLTLSIFEHVYGISALAIDTNRASKEFAALHLSIKPSTQSQTTRLDQLQLFGSTPPAMANLTNSNYTLLGIEYSEKDPTHAKVIISTASGEDEIYQAGDKLSSGIIISQIQPDSVILMQNGIKQKLSLSWEGDTEISHTAEAPELLNDLSQRYHPDMNTIHSNMQEYIHKN